MDGWRRYLELRIRAKTGLSSGVVVWALVALLGAILTFVFAMVTAYIWLADLYEPLVAALLLGGLFLLISVLALVLCAWTHNRNMSRAQLELATRRSAPWLDPRLMAPMLQASRSVGGPKLLALVAIGFLVAGIGMQWLRHDRLAAIKSGADQPFAS